MHSTTIDKLKKRAGRLGTIMEHITDLADRFEHGRDIQTALHNLTQYASKFGTDWCRETTHLLNDAWIPKVNENNNEKLALFTTEEIDAIKALHPGVLFESDLKKP
jgi:hypothetical protein